MAIPSYQAVPLPRPYDVRGLSIPLPKKTITCMVLAIVTMSLAFAALGSAWWHTEFEFEGETETWYGELENVSASAEIDYDLEDEHIDLNAMGETEEASGKTSESLSGDMEDVGSATSILGLVSAIMALLVMIFAIIAIVLLYVRFPQYTRIFMNLILIFALIAMIFAIIFPIYYLAAWPGAVEEKQEEAKYSFYDGGFIGSNSVEYKTEDENVKVEGEWGPTTGWYLGIVTMILAITTMVFAILARKEFPRVAAVVPPQVPVASAVSQAQVPSSVQTFTPTPTPQPAPVTIRCPTCGTNFQVPSTPRPLEVVCPKCGAKGTLK